MGDNKIDETENKVFRLLFTEPWFLSLETPRESWYFRILDGKQEIGAQHEKSNFCYFICVRHLTISRCFYPKDFFSFMIYSYISLLLMESL